MPVTWKTTDSFERLLAAWWASSETHKPNYRLIAKYYGKGTTYDSIEGRFRHIKRQAEALKAECASSSSADAIDLDSSTQSFASPSASFNGSSQNGNAHGNGSATPKKARAPRTPKKDGTSAGRVSKNTTPTKTPTKRGRVGGVGVGVGVAAGRNGNGNGHAQAVKVEMASQGDGERSGSGSESMLDELNEVVDGEVDWMGGGLGGGRRAEVEVEEGYAEGFENANGGYWDGEEEDLGEMV